MNKTKNTYEIKVIERIELTVLIDAFTLKEARQLANRHDFEVDERTAVNLPTQVHNIKLIK